MDDDGQFMDETFTFMNKGKEYCALVKEKFFLYQIHLRVLEKFSTALARKEGSVSMSGWCSLSLHSLPIRVFLGGSAAQKHPSTFPSFSGKGGWD
jgi:hypothetical protein